MRVWCNVKQCGPAAPCQIVYFSPICVCPVTVNVTP